MYARFYFNAWKAKPRIWSLDQGTQATEKEVRNIDIRGCNLRTGTDPTVQPGDKLRPRVWFETDDAQNITIGLDEIAYVVGPGS
jgi:hypothetical protein